MPAQPVRIALDLETTGLNPEQDAIIEIGAIKFSGEQVLDTFQTFVAPGTTLPYRIQRLTGIKPADLRNAPPVSAVAGRLRGFLGDLPLVGHNIPFDVAFLRRIGLGQRNPLVDTYELATMLLPSLDSYTLASVGSALRVPSTTHHRALADADLSRAVFLALLARLNDLSPTVRDMLAALPAPPDWTPRYFLGGRRLASRGSSAGNSPFAGALATSLGAQLSNKLNMDPAVLSMAVALGGARPTPDVAPEVRVDAVVAPITQYGTLDAVKTLGDRISATLERSGVLLVEAQPGDDTLHGYLEPALRWAAQEQSQVLICAADASAAATLAHDVLPRLAASLDLGATSVEVAEISEHEQYLCLHRWFGLARAARDSYESRDVTRGLAKLVVWAHGTSAGDRSEITLAGPELSAWERTRAGAEFADSQVNCPYRANGYCFVANAQDSAKSARIVVSTHAALAEQLAGVDAMLPEATRVIILDAHLWEERLRDAAGSRLDQETFLAVFDTLAEVRGKNVRAGLFHLAARVPGSHERAWFDSVQATRGATRTLFACLRTLLQQAQNNGDRDTQRGEAQEQRVLVLDASLRQRAAWADVLRAWHDLRPRLTKLAELAHETANTVRAAETPRAPLASNGLVTDLLASARTLQALAQRGDALFTDAPPEEALHWLRLPYPPASEQNTNANRRRKGGQPPRRRADQPDETGGGAEINSRADTSASPDTTPARPSASEPSPVVHAAPLRLGPLEEPLWQPGHALIMTGPALAVAGDFEHIRDLLSLPDDTKTFALAANYEEQTLLCLPEDIPEPNTPQYQSQCDHAMIELARALKGRLVAIFPSHAALRASAYGIRKALERDDILVLAQGLDGSARQLWNTFDSQERVVLLGAGTFWDGHEHEQHPPACVVVSRLPFPALSDPLTAARAGAWQEPQSQFVVPQASLKLRRALNGLTWSSTQRNAVVLLDRRVQTRSYGQTVLGSLPRCTQYQETTERVVERVAEWVAHP